MEEDLEKRRKIDSLKLKADEWVRVKHMVEILMVCDMQSSNS